MATELPADVDELRKMLKQRDAEIEKLQRKLEPQPSWGEIVVKSFTSSKGGSANASSTSLDKSAPTSTAPTVVAVEEEEPKDPTAGAITALEPLLAQVQVWQLELAQHAATGGAAVEKAVAPVAAALQEWQETTVAPLVAQGGDAVKVAVAPLIEAPRPCGECGTRTHPPQGLSEGPKLWACGTGGPRYHRWRPGAPLHRTGAAAAAGKAGHCRPR